MSGNQELYDWVSSQSQKQTTQQTAFVKSVPKNGEGPTKLGVDGGYLLALARQEIHKDDPNWALAAAVPPSLKSYLTDFIAKVKNCNMQPVFVFDGMSCVKKADNTSSTEQNVKRIDWVESQQSGDPLPRAFDGTDIPTGWQTTHVFDDDVVAWTIRWLQKEQQEVFTAPYLAWAQLAAFLAPDNKYICDVFASPEILAFDFVSRVLVELTAKSVISFSKEKLQKALEAKAKAPPPDAVARFLLGHSPHPSLAVRGKKELIDKDGGDLAGPGHDHVLKEHLPTIQWCPVMTHRGECQPLRKLNPDDDAESTTRPMLRELFSHNLQSECPILYFFEFINVISSQILSVLSGNKIVDHAPLLDTAQYRTTLETIIPLRAQIIFQLVQDLPCVRNREFNLLWMRTFIPSRVTPILKPPEIKLDDWQIISNDRKDLPSQIDLVSVLNYESYATQAPQHYGSCEEAIAATYLKSLDLLGYFTHAAHASDNRTEVSSKSVYGSALGEAATSPEEGVLLIELLRTRALHTDAYTENTNKQVIPNEAKDSSTVIASRILSLVSIEIDGPWSAEYYPSLLAFNAVARTFQRSLRWLLEVIAVKLFIGEPRRNNFTMTDYKDLASKLPFSQPLACYGGIIVTYILEDDEYSKAPPGQRLQMLNDKFPECSDLQNDLMRLKKFWQVAENIMTTLSDDQALDEELRKSMNEAKVRLDAKWPKL